jgi:RHS repeat-associated protein
MANQRTALRQGDSSCLSNGTTEAQVRFWGNSSPSYYRARYYDTNVGRFLNEDPARFETSTNFYSYLDNDPTSSIDPSGLCKVDVRYTAAKRLGVTIGYHATIIVADDVGSRTPFFYRGQPSGDWWKPSTHLEALSGFDKSDPALNPDWDPKAPAQRALDACGSCQPIIEKLDLYVLRKRRTEDVLTLSVAD